MFSSSKKTFSVISVATVLSLICSVGTTRADLVANGDFSTPNGVGWSSGGPDAPLPGSYYNCSDHGDQSPNLEMHAGAGTRDWIEQTIGTVTANTTYTVSVDVQRDSASEQHAIILPELYYDNGGTWTKLDADGPYGFDLPVNEVVWKTYTTTYTNPSHVGADLEVRFGAIHPEGDGANPWIDVDNIAVHAITTPEPGTLVLLAVGVLSLLAYAWRKRK